MVSNENYQASWKHAWQVEKIRYLAQQHRTCHKIAELLDLYKHNKAAARKAYVEAAGGRKFPYLSAYETIIKKFKSQSQQSPRFALRRSDRA